MLYTWNLYCESTIPQLKFSFKNQNRGSQPRVILPILPKGDMQQCQEIFLVVKLEGSGSAIGI